MSEILYCLYRLLQVTFYIAEFWNTVTNLSMIIPPIYGIYAASKYNFEKRYQLWMPHFNRLKEILLYPQVRALLFVLSVDRGRIVDVSHDSQGKRPSIQPYKMSHALRKQVIDFANKFTT